MTPQTIETPQARNASSIRIYYNDSLHHSNRFLFMVAFAVVFFFAFFDPTRSLAQLSLDERQYLELPPEVQKQVRQALVEADRGNYKETEVLFRKVIKQVPNYAKAHHNLALLLSRMERHDEAEAAIQPYLKANPKSSSSWKDLGDIYLFADRFHEAISAYSQGIEIEPKRVDLYYNRSLARSRICQTEQSINDLQITLRLDPNYLQARTLLSFGYLQLYKLEAAKDEANLALKINKSDATAWLMRGIACYGLDQIYEANLSFKNCIDLDPKQATEVPLGKIGLATTLKDMKQYTKAMAHIDGYLKTDGKDVRAWCVKAEIFKLDGKLDESIKLYSKALALDPQQVAIYLGRADAYARMRDYDNASSDYQKAIKLHPSVITVRIQYAEFLLFSLKKIDAAMLELDMAFKINKYDVKALALRGLCYYASGNPTKSTECFKKCLSMAPEMNVKIEKEKRRLDK